MRARAAASIALVVLLGGGLAGCNFTTPQATTYPYDPSDGVGTTVGEIELRNVLAITEDGTEANLVFSAVNNSDSDVTLTGQVGTGSSASDVTVTLTPGYNELGYDEAGQVVLTGVDSPAGSLMPVYFQYGEEPGKEINVPVLDGSLPEYEGLLPMPVPTPTDTAIPGDTATPPPGNGDDADAESGENN